MSRIIKILLLEDSPEDAELVNDALKQDGINFEILIVDNRAHFLRELWRYMPDIVLCDHHLPTFSSTDAFTMLKHSGIKMPFLLVTGHCSEEYCTRLVQQGMDGYVRKQRFDLLPAAVLAALDKYHPQIDAHV